MSQFLAIAAYLVAMVGTMLFISGMPVVLLSLLLKYRRTGQGRRDVLIALLIIAGYCAGGAASWHLLPFDWSASFFRTLQMSVDAKTYGHATEHKAESILVAVMFFSVVGACFTGVLANRGLRLRQT